MNGPDDLAAGLVTELAALSPVPRSAHVAWPGMTVHRFPNAVPVDVEELSLCVLIPLSPRSAPATYLVAGAGDRLGWRDLTPAAHHPALCMLLAIDPRLVRSVDASIRDAGTSIAAPKHTERQCLPIPLDDELGATVLRFARSLRLAGDRRVLAPLHLHELVYRVLGGEQGDVLRRRAAGRERASPVAAALDYIDAHLVQPLSVDTLAAQVSLSPSAFSRAFRDKTGHSPYQYVKEKRLNRSRQLLLEDGLGVGRAARAVGYVSVSHFIKEFRIRFGDTPGDYAAARVTSPAPC